MRALAVVAVVLAAGTAHAGSLRWDAPAECGDAAALEARVAVHLGRALDAGDPLDAEVEVTRDEAAGDYRAAMRIVTPGALDEREVRAADCAAVADAVAFVLALAVQDVEAAPVVVEPAPEPVMEPAPVVMVRATPRRTLEVRARLDAEVAAGTLPGAGLGAAGALSLGLAPVRLELGAAWYAPGRATAPAAGMVGADIDLVAARARLCGVRAPWRLCGGGAVGRMRGRGVGVDDARTASRRWSAVTMAGRWERRIAGPFAVTVELEAGVTVDRPRFVLDDGTLLHEPGPALARLAIGIEAALY